MVRVRQPRGWLFMLGLILNLIVPEIAGTIGLKQGIPFFPERKERTESEQN